MAGSSYSATSGTNRLPPNATTGIVGRLPVFWRFQIVGWLAFIGFSLPLDWVVLPDIPWSAVAALGKDVLAFIFTLGMRGIYQKFLTSSPGPFKIALLISLLSVIGGILLTLATLGLHAAGDRDSIASFTPGVLFAIFYFRTAICAGWSLLYVLIKMMRESMTRDIADAKRDAQQQHLEVQMLRAQMNPHFLFNALNTISASVAKSDQFSRNLISALSDYLRYSLKNRNADLVPLAEELDALDAYLAVERARFRQDLEYRSDIEPVARTKLVPGVIIQPLIENAIKHGKKTSPLPLKIRLAITRPTLYRLRVEVWNTGRWSTLPVYPVGTSGVGLENLRKRVDLLYRHETAIDVSEADGWICVSIELPITP